MKRGPGRPRKEKTVPMFVRFPERLAKMLREKAKRERRDISATIAMIVETAIYTTANRGSDGA
jgi:hypothetical protein